MGKISGWHPAESESQLPPARWILAKGAKGALGVPQSKPLRIKMGDFFRTGQRNEAAKARAFSLLVFIHAGFDGSNDPSSCLFFGTTPQSFPLQPPKSVEERQVVEKGRTSKK